MIPPFNERPVWLKSRGYLHLTPKIDIIKHYVEIYSKVTNEEFVARHAFFPLIHTLIKERKFKKIPGKGIRAHSYVDSGKTKKTAKNRPLHYATHIDALIFGYYAKILLDRYEEELSSNSKYIGLTDSITAYRKLALDSLKDNNKENELEDKTGKSTIHFAHEAFEEIKRRSASSCQVLMFDIESFFSTLDHDQLKKAWCRLLNVERLNSAHFNVFKAATNFRYILKDQLRIKRNKHGRKSGFDEKKLFFIRKKYGKEAFFTSEADFRRSIKDRELQVFKNPFVVAKKPVGIPQGLPISAVLANLYLLEFDKEIYSKVVVGLNGFYKRYSDDILIICEPEYAEEVESIVLSAIEKSNLKISKHKTEKYLFKQHQVSNKKKKLVSILLEKEKSVIGKPLTYLGFEFNGEKTLIKSANLAKFYRRMIYTVKRKATRAKKNQNPDTNPIIYKGRIKRMYTLQNLNIQRRFTKVKKLKKNSEGFYEAEYRDVSKRIGSNYLTYVNRASNITKEDSISKQIRKHRNIFNAAITKYLRRHI